MDTDVLRPFVCAKKISPVAITVIICVNFPFSEILTFPSDHSSCTILISIATLSPFVEDKVVGQVLFRSYDCFFAEFLGDFSLVRLTLLELTTCVGLRYGSRVIMLRKFSWKRALYNSLWRIARFRNSSKYCSPDLPKLPPDATDSNPITSCTYCTPSFHRIV